MSSAWFSLRPLLQLTFQTALLLFWAFMTWRRYTVYYSELTTAAVTVQQLPFPSFSLCPAFPTEYTQHPRAQRKGFLAGVFWKYFNASTHGNVTNFVLRYVQAPMQEFLTRLCVGKNKCSSEMENYWELVYTRAGICFTFRPQAHQSAATDGTRQRVTFVVDHPYGGRVASKIVAHFNIFIHGEESLVTSVRQEYRNFLIQESMATYILRRTFKVKWTRTISANTRKRPCNPDPAYQTNLCKSRCLWRQVVSLVGCKGPWMLLRDAPACETAEQLYNASIVQDEFEFYNTAVELNLHNYSIPILPCKCPPRCSIDTFTLDKETAVRQPSSQHQSYKKLVLQLDRELVVTTSSVPYGLVSLLSEAGGNGGLLLGYSLMTVLDVVLDLVLKLVKRTEEQA